MIESLEIAQAVAEATARHCTDVVMSPGSRNSPLAYALIARDDITVHMRIDERSAAFTALGIARVQRRHVAVVMTSGTAVANAYPALIEAHMSHTPPSPSSARTAPRASSAPARAKPSGKRASSRATQPRSKCIRLSTPRRCTSSPPQIHINVALDTPLVPQALPGRTGAPRRVGPGVLSGSAAFVEKSFRAGLDCADDRSKVTHRVVRWILQRLAVDRMSIQATANALGISWQLTCDLALSMTRELISDPDHLAGVRVIGVDEHKWAHNFRAAGGGFVTVIVDMEGVRFFVCGGLVYK